MTPQLDPDDKADIHTLACRNQRHVRLTATRGRDVSRVTAAEGSPDTYLNVPRERSGSAESEKGRKEEREDDDFCQ